MRLYAPHRATLLALAGADVDLMLGIPESDLPKPAKRQCHADAWVRANVAAHPAVKFRHIAVGNEVNTSSPNAPFVLPAMQHIHVTVSTSICPDLLGKSSPPSAGKFRSDVAWYIKRIIEFLNDTNAPLLVNVYPYFVYMDDIENVNRSFALLQPNSGEFLGDVYYDNLFYAIIDAVYAAMEKLLARSLSLSLSSSLMSRVVTPGVTVSETGHSSRGDRRPPPATAESVAGGEYGDWSSVENARIYNNNLMRIVKSGTPKRPNAAIEAYIFAMFDVDGKTGAEYERHFGVFLANGKRKYGIRFY